jgi:hypothetical protein
MDIVLSRLYKAGLGWGCIGGRSRSRYCCCCSTISRRATASAAPIHNESGSDGSECEVRL